MVSGVMTDVGMVRDNNQDSYFVPVNEDIPLFVVADGMGGHKAGEIASNMAINIIKDTFLKLKILPMDEISITKLIEQSIKEANEKIYLRSIEKEAYSGMGTTVTLAYIINRKLCIGHVGDSRAYLFKDENLIQITEDHSLVNELVKNGSITLEEAKTHPQRNIITRAVGTSETIEMDIVVREYEEGNILLLCSDGLTSMVKDSQIQDILSKEKNIQKACENLVSLSNDNGGYDNTTVIAIKF
jgi:protein phosphatase